MLSTGLPKYLTELKQKIETKLTHLKMPIDINHVLINEYEPGDGIMARVKYFKDLVYNILYIT